MLRRLIFILLLGPSAAMAEDLAEGWSGRATIYGWLTALDAEATVTGPRGGTSSARGSAGIGDVVDALNFAFFANAELRRGRFGVIGDVVYADLNFNGTNARGVRRDLDMSSFLGTASLAWRAWQDEAAWIDLLGGARYVSSRATISRAGPLVSARAESSADWVDPVVGLRGRYAIADRTSIFGLVDMGGFGVGSEIAWEAMAGLGYDFTQRVSGELAFRYLRMDYDDGPVEQRLEMYGPLLGLSVKF